MKRLLFLTGLVMAAVLNICCKGNAKTPTTDLGDGSTKIVKINGKSVEVDAITAKNFTPTKIGEAIVREKFTSQLPKITNASSLGKKRAEVVWRAIVPRINSEDLGKVSVTYYDKGVQITKDGKSWFYGGIKYEGLSTLYHVTATESVLHRDVWEPVYVEVAVGNRPDFRYHFLHKGKCKEDHWLLLLAFDREEFNINSISDLQISVKEY